MTLSWIGQKTLGAGGVTKQRVFGLPVGLSGQQAQSLEPRDKGVCVCGHRGCWVHVNTAVLYVGARLLLLLCLQTQDHTAGGG